MSYDVGENDGPALAVQIPGKGRHYRRPGTDALYPSITSIIGILDKPKLIGWAAKETAGAAWDQRHALVSIEDREAAVDMLKNARYRTSKPKQQVGTVVHAVAEALATGAPLPSFTEKEEPYLDAFLSFVSDFDPTFEVVEGTVFSDTHEYAGTFDFLATIGGQLLLGDHKTGSGVYEEVALQTAAGRWAEWLWDEPTGELRPMPETAGAIAVHLRPGKYAVHLLDAGPATFRAFCGLRKAWPWAKGGENQGAVGPPMNPVRLAEAVGSPAVAK